MNQTQQSIDQDEFQLCDDGTLDTVIMFRGAEFRFSDTSSYRDQTGLLDMQRFLADHAEYILEQSTLEELDQ